MIDMTKRAILLSVLLALATLSSSFAEDKIVYKVGFEGYFDNREYLQRPDMKEYSGTDFAVRIQPAVGYAFAQGNTIYFGADMIQPIGAETSTFFGQITPLLYYSYSSPRWSAVAGVFDRSHMRLDAYSRLFFSDNYLFSDDVVAGVLGRYSVDESFVEFVCDWEGSQSVDTREQFRILSAGRRQWKNLYVAYALSLKHFAGQAEGGEFDNVVDNILLNPHLGARFESGRWNFDLRVGYIQSLQRDRTFSDKWLSPMMGEAGFKIEYRGLSINESIYVGDNVMPLYGGHILDDGRVMEYGSNLYAGDPLLTTEGGFYNRASIKYERRWANDRVSLRVEFVTHATSTGFGTEQILGLTVNLGGDLYNRNNRK